MKYFVLISSLWLVSCNFQKMKVPQSGPPGSDRQIAGMSFGYAAVSAMIVGPKCVSCHDSKGVQKGGVALDSYALVRSQMTRIAVRSLDKKDMPPDAPLSSAEQSALAQWLKRGAPEHSTTARDKLTPPPGTLTWKYVRENVLQTCLQCHSQPEPEGGLDLTEAEVVRKSIHQVFDRTVVKKLCPLPPLPALIEDEQNVLVKWISQGMPD